MALALTQSGRSQFSQVNALYPEAHEVLKVLTPQILRNPTGGCNVGTLGLFRTEVERLLAEALKKSGWPSDVWVAWQDVPTPGRTLKRRVAYWVYRLGPPSENPQHRAIVASLMGCNVVFEDGKLLIPPKPAP